MNVEVTEICHHDREIKPIKEHKGSFIDRELSLSCSLSEGRAVKVLVFDIDFF